MPTLGFPLPTREMDLAQLAEYLAKVVKEIEWALANMDTKNLKVNGVDADRITAHTITADRIAANAITANEIAANTITANEIAANAITTSELKAGAVTADKISVTQLSAISADIGTITAGSITSNSTISVATDATIGNKLLLSRSNYGNGVRWGTSSGLEIFIDPASSALHLSASGGIYANGKRIDI